MKPSTILIIVLSVALLSSCGPSYHLRRAKHHLKMAEVKGANLNSDTVFVIKEVVVPKIEYDTVLSYRNFRDTVTVVKNGIVTHVKIDTVKKTLYVAVDCPPDTVRVRVPVTVTQKIEPEFPWGWVLLSFILGGITGLIVTKNRSS